MNRLLAALALILSVAVVLLSAAVFYFSKCKCQGQPGPVRPFSNPMNMQMPFPMEQQQPVPGNIPPGGQPDFMGGPNMGRGHQSQQPQRGMGVDTGQGRQGEPGMGGQQSPGRQSRPMPESAQNQSGSRDQTSKMMQEATQEAQSYFRNQNRKPEHQEMLSKVKELLARKMNAQGIPLDVQQKILSEMDQRTPPQQSQPRL